MSRRFNKGSIANIKLSDFGNKPNSSKRTRYKKRTHKTTKTQAKVILTILFLVFILALVAQQWALALILSPFALFAGVYIFRFIRRIR
jgi:Kef-type K+ transport system membrane component KefB